jgi:hypothetical protein
VTAIVVAVVCHQRFTLYRLGIAADRVNAEFLQVMGNMLSLLGGVLVLALATLIFERGGLVPKGRWVAPSDDRQVPQKV